MSSAKILNAYFEASEEDRKELTCSPLISTPRC